MIKPYYADDLATLYHGDCREILPTISGIDLTVTSPPYNTLGRRVGRASGLHARKGVWVGNLARNGYADDMPEDEYVAWVADVFLFVAQSTKPGGSLFFNHKCRWRETILHHPIDLVRKFSGFSLRQEIIWNRGGSTTLNAKMFPPCEERIYWLVRDGARWKWKNTPITSVWSLYYETAVESHPCPYPSEIPSRAIISTTDEGDVVLDPFAGSGTTLLAAADLNRKAIGIEIEERYCEIAARRLSSRTGNLFAPQPDARLDLTKK